MNNKSWRWAVAISALAFGFAACTVTTTDGSSDGGVGGQSQGGSAGSGGQAQAGTGGSGGQAQGGQAGQAQGGQAGQAQGGQAGQGQGGAAPVHCSDLDDSDACTACVKKNCCKEFDACTDDPNQLCAESRDCFWQCDEDAQTCARKCAKGDAEQHEPWNNLFNCLNDNCMDACTASGSGGAAGAGS